MNISGDSNVVWKHGESVVFAGGIKIRKDLRIKLVDGTSLYIKEATRAYAGKCIFNADIWMHVPYQFT